MKIKGMVFDIDSTRNGRTVLFVADEDGKGSMVKVICDDAVGVKKGDVVEIIGRGFGVVTIWGQVKGGKNG
jgi:hypothetical protein